ncbi:Predicted transcriptional regulator [Alteracholeplasma palmae J233]|uniref:Predicted transcriptional regulator n=1 Tax=Alteracholeplasma palmae (strain ATCC 49389 / J233) TaxID=1318466 RepID=U4KN43_ALTPJ|nr:RNA-binding domain-containing protein [Alteracholeplasma palmae]CCV63585.1 Predicted transcriptional regulator [Alteracholeplasma palmae J233]
MTKLFKEESNTIEYKKTLPNETERWLKSIVSFSNTSGGELIIGVEDSTLNIYGIHEVRSVFEQKIMETIYNNIEPKPIVDIVFKNIENKDIAIIQVLKGNEQPYFIRKQGIEEGCYIRFGSTDQKASNSQRTELLLNKKNENYTNKIYDEQGTLFSLKDIDISAFLLEINNTIKTNKEITINKLIEWNIVKKSFGELYATNGLMLLLGQGFNYSNIRIGFFSGITKSKLIDEITVTGSIIKQYNEVMKILLDKLKTHYKIKTLREQQYKVPEETLREIIANAIIHRNYLEQEPIKISLFDDRIEIFSPGNFFDGLQLEDALNGISKLRNPNISEIFYHIGIIEKWGSGIKRANEALEENLMNQLVFEIRSAHGINVIIKFDKDNIKAVEHSVIDEENYLEYKKDFTRKQLEQELGFTTDQARYLIEKWLSKGKVTKSGGGPSTIYKVNK